MFFNHLLQFVLPPPIFLISGYPQSSIFGNIEENVSPLSKETPLMKKIERMAIWLCNKFTRAELEIIIAYLLDVLANRNPEVKPRDDFKEKHPNYRKFSVDPNPPLTKPPDPPQPTKNWRKLLKEYFKKHDKQLEPVKHKKKL